MNSLNIELTEEEYTLLVSHAKSYDILERKSCFWCKGTFTVIENLRKMHKPSLANDECACKYGLCTCSYCVMLDIIHETDESH